MKKILTPILCFVLAVVMSIVSACGDDKHKEEEIKAAVKEKPKGDAARRIYFKKLCDEHNFGVCGELGVMFEHGYGGSKDNKMATKYHLEACDHGVRDSCRAINKKLTPKQELAIYKADCQKNYKFSCNNLGQILLAGQGVPKDAVAARAALKKGCDAGSPRSCKILAKLMNDGVGGPKDVDGAKKIQQKSIDLLNTELRNEKIALGVTSVNRPAVKPPKAFLDMIKGEYDAGGPSEGLNWQNEFKKRSRKAIQKHFEEKKKHNHSADKH